MRAAPALTFRNLHTQIVKDELVIVVVSVPLRCGLIALLHSHPTLVFTSFLFCFSVRESHYTVLVFGRNGTPCFSPLIVLCHQLEEADLLWFGNCSV